MIGSWSTGKFRAKRIDSVTCVPYRTNLATRSRRPYWGTRVGCGRLTMIDPGLLELLVCPVPQCRGKLELAAERLRCAACGLRYEITGGWPNLIPEDASPSAAPDEEASD